MPKQSKILEIDILVPTLRHLAESAKGCLSTAELTAMLEALFQPTDVNAVLNANGLSAFSQIVRNTVSNRHVGKNLINRGFATYNENSRQICITQRGRELLAEIGY